jgi:hypothetical protein
MFKHTTRSYRDLPMRFADFGVLHRNEYRWGGGEGGGETCDDDAVKMHDQATGLQSLLAGCLILHRPPRAVCAQWGPVRPDPRASLPAG